MADLNSCSFTGRVGGDPDIRISANGTQVANFSLAIQGFKREDTTWLRCSAFGKTAVIAGDWVKKGSQIAVHGRLSCREWQDRDGMKRESWELSVGDLTLLGSSNARREDPVEHTRHSQQAPQVTEVNPYDDDIPF